MDVVTGFSRLGSVGVVTWNKSVCGGYTFYLVL